MTQLRPQWRGLIFKLALFYIGLSLPTLILVESTILIFEFESFMGGVERGSLARASERAAAELGRQWPSDAADRGVALDTWLEAWILRLERPREGLAPEESYVLLELSPEPLVAALVTPEGRLLARAPRDADWEPELPRPGELGFAGTGDATPATAAKAVTLAGADSPYRVRRVATPVRGPDGRVLGVLFVELRLPLPWRKFLLELSFEWPIVFAYLIVFGIASSVFLSAWVTRRLNRVARAAEAWSRGDFTNLIEDASRDELGRLSARLDRMAVELKSLMRSRAQLATLEERQRLARDLHDTVKQKAFALNLQLATARRVHGDGADARLEQAQRLCHEIQRELASILDDVRPRESAPFGVRLRGRAEDWSRASGIGVEVAIEGDVPALPVALEESLLRILEEALANVLRHSGATRAVVTLGRETDRLLLSIADNGRGAAGDAREGMGLRNMRERADALPEGRFALDSLPGRGTRVAVGLRLPRADDREEA